MLMQYAPLVGAVLAGVCQAAPSKILSPEVPIDVNVPIEAEIAGRSLAPISWPVNQHWNQETLFSGLIDAQANVQLGLSLPQAAIKGDIGIEIGADFLLAPTVKVLLGGVQANIALDLAATAGVSSSVELVTAEQLKVAIPALLELDVVAGLALDLVFSASAAVELGAGFYVNFPEGSFVEINILTNEIVKQSLGGLVAVPLPIAVGAEVDLSAEIEIQLGLRLRAELGIEAGVDIIGLDIGAGAGISIYAALFDYTTVLVNTPECALSVVESFDFNIGVIVNVDIEVADLSLTIAPTISATLAAAPVATICLPPGGGAIPLPGVNTTNPGQQVPGHGNVGGEKPTSTDAAVGTITAAPTNVNQTGPYPTATDDLITSTIHTTKTYTITSCAASVPNCPAEHTQQIVTSTVISTVVTCPASTSTDDSVPTPVTAHTTVTLTTCPVPTTGTFVPPTDKPTQAPTVTICESTTPGYPASTPSGKPSGYPTKPAPVTTPSGYPTGGEVTPTPLPSVSYPAEKPSVSYPAEQPSSYPVQKPSSYPAEQPSYPAQQPTYPASTPVQAPAPSGTGASYPEQPCSTCLPVAAGAGRAMSHALAGVVVAGAAFALL